MAIIQALVAFLFRATSPFLNAAFGWATVMLFGKVPQNRQIYLSVIGLGSVVWIIALLGIVFPSFATFLLVFVTLPAWVARIWARPAMLALAAVTPLVVGYITTRIFAPEERPRGGMALAAALLQGYPSTLGLALTLILMTVFAPVLEIRALVRGWTRQHIPVVARADDYLGVVAEVEKALRKGGLQARRRHASWMLRFPTRILALLAGRAMQNLVADNLTTLRTAEVEVLLYPADLVISGRETEAAQARAAIAEHLPLTRASMTWEKGASALEDRLRSIWNEVRHRPTRFTAQACLASLRAVERDLRALQVPYDDWEVLFREKLLVERRLLRLAAGLGDEVEDRAGSRPGKPGPARAPAARIAPRLALLPAAIGAILFVLLLARSTVWRRAAIR
ncbi:MAG: hypothetical protein HYY04_11520 [Chloroflexi bacterium]|nr:hypothetical protein [Chloroflexota bacterium]